MKVLLLLFTLITFSFASIGKVSAVVGDAKIQRNSKTLVIKTGLKIEKKDIIHTSKNSKVQLIFSDNTIITVGKNSALNIKEYLYDLKNPKNSKTDFHFFKGAFKTITGKIGKINKKRFKLRTKTASIGIRGTIILGNQDVIACTHGGITVEGSGISVDVDANELTVIQDNQAPSEAKEMTLNDVKSLESQIEPEIKSDDREVTKEEEKENEGDTSSTDEPEEESTEKSTSNDESEEADTEESTENATSNDEPEDNPILKNTPQETIIDSTIDEEVADINDDEGSNLAQDSSVLITQAQTLSATIENKENEVKNLKTETITSLEELPSVNELSTIQTNAQTLVSETNSSLSELITLLNTSSSSSNLTNTSRDGNTFDEDSTALTNQSASFNVSVEGDYSSLLETAKTNATKAQNAYANLLLEAKEIDTILVNAKQNGASASIIIQLESQESKINASLEEARLAANEATQAVNTLESKINETNTILSSSAQEASSNAIVIKELENIYTSLETIKQSKIDIVSNKNATITAKTATQNASNNASNTASTLSSLKQDVINANAETTSAFNTTQIETNTALNASTKNIQVAYSAKIALDNSALARTKSDLAASKVLEVNTKLQEAKDFVLEMNTQLNNAKTALITVNTKLSEAQTNLATAKNTRDNIDSSNTQALQAANDAVIKAQALYDEAFIEKGLAQTAVNEAQITVDNLDETNFIDNLENEKNTAQSSADLANINADSAEALATNATNAAKTASTNLKTTILAKNKKSLEQNGNKDLVDNSSDTFVLSEVETNKINTNKDFGGYTHTTQIGTFKTNEEDVNASYKVQADNLQEFFISYSSSSNPNKSLTTYGNASTHVFDTSKIYIYQDFKKLDAPSSSSASFDNEKVIHYYNPATGSYTSLAKDFYKMGANYFVVGNSSGIKTIKNTFETGNDNFIDSITATKGTGTFNFFGSQAQGLTQTTVENNADNTLNQNTQSAAFLSDKQSTNASSDFSLSGKVFLISYEDGATGARSEDITIDFTNATKSISATAKYGNGSTIMEYEGNIASQTAYYINQDIFGVEAKGLSGGKNGFLIAVPDGGYDSDSKFKIYDENDNPLTSDDDSSWGYWTGKDSFTTSKTASVSPLSTWVAGIETKASTVNNLLNGSNQTLTFNGKVLGVVDYKNPIILDDSNQVKLNFDVGGGSGSLSGYMKFKSTNNASFDLTINSSDTTVSSTGFNGRFSGAKVDNSFNYFGGKYYGDGEVKSVGGNISVRQDGHQVSGVFKATKQ